MYRILAVLALGALMSCNSKKVVTQTIPLDPDIREMDTLVVTAPPPDVEEVKGPEDYTLPDYRASQTRTSDLLHTALDLNFNWEEEQVIGVARLKLSPYFYSTDQVVLDAKGFTFNKISLSSGKELKYEYDGQLLTVMLDREYSRDEEYELVIDYVATPKADGGSGAITSDKGLFFINPRGEEGDKPMQIWTQGETEHNSRWFPTIDQPNERCTQEMYLTVENRFKTLSNGLLLSSTDNGDGTRTDYWKMDQAHAPYLFMIAVGEFAVVSEEWNGRPVEYYVEPEYEEYAEAIFPYTPEMLTFFSEILGVEYPWQKYSQVVVRDYVSGAMENTTGVIFGEFMQGDDRALIDNLLNEKIVAHELFHHWFGDLVTCESWSNLTLNEGFANYSEYLWLEHQHGKDEADNHLMTEWEGYMQSSLDGIHPLIYFEYRDKEDMFDAHSYNKGGMVLHMLRSYLGDDAFFAGLRKYLDDNAYSDVEADELRLAYEDVVGEDLNWFFNQWFFEAGHPILDIEYGYTDGVASVTVEQVQDPDVMPAIFQIPTSVDIYLEDGTKIREEVFVNERLQTFTFDVPSEPKLVTFDGDRAVLCEFQDNKTDEQLVYQFQNSKSFRDRWEALNALTNSYDPGSTAQFTLALGDPFWGIRAMGVEYCRKDGRNLMAIQQLAESDPHSEVREMALLVLAEQEAAGNADLAKRVIENEQAYPVVAAALELLHATDSQTALKYAKKLEAENSSSILSSIGNIYLQTGEIKYLEFFEQNWDKVEFFSAITFMQNYGELAASADVASVLSSGEKLKAIGTDMGQSPWRRFGSMSALNTLHAELIDRMYDEELTEEEMTELSDADNMVVEMIEAIKAAETNPQLLGFYQSFPNPPARP